jgi:hypothetical protein
MRAFGVGLGAGGEARGGVGDGFGTGVGVGIETGLAAEVKLEGRSVGRVEFGAGERAALAEGDSAGRNKWLRKGGFPRRGEERRA